MTFDNTFHGVVYSKGHYSDPQCRYQHQPQPPPNGDLSTAEHATGYEAGGAVPTSTSPPNQMHFTLHPDRCGSRLVEGPQTGETYIENTVVVQNTPGIQSAIDTARAVRCVFEPRSGPGSIVSRTVASSLSVDVLDVISVTYSGDSIDSYLDIQLGKGPFHASPVNGLVKIGETLTLVVYIHGEDYDVHVKDCMAHDGNAANAIRLSDARGCVYAPKLMGPWQKTRATANTGASAIAWAYLEAFKFPDKLEVFIECNIEICKYQCHHDPHECLVGRKRKASSSTSSSSSSRKRRAAVTRNVASSNGTSTEARLDGASYVEPAVDTSDNLKRSGKRRRHSTHDGHLDADLGDDHHLGDDKDTNDDDAIDDVNDDDDGDDGDDDNDHRNHSDDETQPPPAESAHLMRGIRVVAPEDSIDASSVPVRSSTLVAVSPGSTDRADRGGSVGPNGLRVRPLGGGQHISSARPQQHNQLCVSTTGFLFVAGLSVTILVALLLTIVGLYLRMRQLDPDVQLVNEVAMAGSMQRRHVIASISDRAGQGAPRRKGDF